MARNNLPGYLKHKTTGQALCVINGRYIYLGKYGSKASRQQYEEVIAEYLSNGRKLPPICVTENGRRKQHRDDDFSFRDLLLRLYNSLNHQPAAST